MWDEFIDLYAGTKCKAGRHFSEAVLTCRSAVVELSEANMGVCLWICLFAVSGVLQWIKACLLNHIMHTGYLKLDDC